MIYLLPTFSIGVDGLIHDSRRELLTDCRGYDLLLVDGTITGTFFDTFEFFDNIHAFGDFTEDGVVHVKPRGGRGGDKKLTTISAWACVGHSENTCFIEL